MSEDKGKRGDRSTEVPKNRSESEIKTSEINTTEDVSEGAVSLETETGTEEETVTETEPEVVDPIALLTEEVKTQKDKYLRLMAEFDNYKRRSIKEYNRIVESANENLMREIIEVRENFCRALKPDNKDAGQQTMIEGVTLIFTKLDDILKKNGLTMFGEKGDLFDPALHDALMKVPHDEVPENHLVEVYEQGYRLRTMVIHHAKVIVSSGLQEASED
jgi:molecular chaperone GrpE